MRPNIYPFPITKANELVDGFAKRTSTTNLPISTQQDLQHHLIDNVLFKKPNINHHLLTHLLHSKNSILHPIGIETLHQVRTVSPTACYLKHQ